VPKKTDKYIERRAQFLSAPACACTHADRCGHAQAGIMAPTGEP